MVGLLQHRWGVVNDRSRSYGDAGEPGPKQAGHLRSCQFFPLHSSAPYCVAQGYIGRPRRTVPIVPRFGCGCPATVVLMILVTGASGTIGSHVLRLLAQSGHPARAMMRSRPGRTVPPDVDVVQADFEDHASLHRAVAGVRAVFLLTAPATPTPDHDLALLAVARTAGVSSVVKLSAIGTGERFGAATVGAWHQTAEDAVRASGLTWTILRPSSFASNCLHWAGAIRAGEPVHNVTGDGEQGVIDPGDIAAVAVAALTDPAHAGKIYTLTGPELLSVPDQASHLSEVVGRPVVTVDVPPATASRQLLASGMPPAAVRATVIGTAWARAGHNRILTDDVARVLGRPPATFRDWARRHREAFAGVP
ncbi:SDR family oxidoreductase [Actinoplanes sp. NPDC049548]|uniref:SDR family oxidoreductase n=1 Tax=Actinoplanes sp. NPDC049548 TaxID=3155152 RepID=UPI003425FAAC